MNRAAVAAFLLLTAVPALPQQRFELAPICVDGELRGLRGTIPKAGPVTIYIPSGLCDGAAPNRPRPSA
jgi:hypothetical protein